MYVPTSFCVPGMYNLPSIASVGLLDAILTILFPLNRRSLFTIWLLLLAVLLVLLVAVLLVLLLAVLFAFFGPGGWLLNGTCAGLSFPTLLLLPTAIACWITDIAAVVSAKVAI